MGVLAELSEHEKVWRGEARRLVQQPTWGAEFHLYALNHALHPARLLLSLKALSKKLLCGSGAVSCMAVHPSGDHVIVGSEDKRLAWFDLDLSDKPYKALRCVVLRRVLSFMMLCLDLRDVPLCPGSRATPCVVHISLVAYHPVQHISLFTSHAPSLDHPLLPCAGTTRMRCAAPRSTARTRCSRQPAMMRQCTCSTALSTRTS